MAIYKITSLVGGFEQTNPPKIVYAVFPSFEGWPVTLSSFECIVHAPDGVNPVDISPLVMIEEIKE